MTIASALDLPNSDYTLLTDLYQLTMAACYIGEGLDQRPASFELFTRRLPPDFGYLIAMGLEQALHYLATLHFTSDQIASLQATGIFAHVPDRVWEVLANGRFTGDVWAVPEGTVVFANQPLLRIEAPLWQAQLVETLLLNTLNYQTLIATRAGRIRDVAGAEATLLEFGTRRAFSPQAALWAARASLAAGFNATSNVLAAIALGQKPAGTMAHALVMAIGALEGHEMEAFAAFHTYFPGAPLLIDTYDTIAAAQQLKTRMETEGMALSGVRIDSGDLATLSQQVKALLPQVPIFASGDLDEYRIAELQAAESCIEGYGIGTQLVTGTPVNGVYKLVEIDGIPVMKASPGKVTYPGKKQIFRSLAAGQFQSDRLGLQSESPLPGEQPVLQLVMQQGQRLAPSEPLSQIADRTRQSIQQLPAPLRQLRHPPAIAPRLTPALQDLTDQVQKRINP
ncbi:MAG: nicotinate phosphoribosyltransferase, partial [Synechococcales bacterium]|nr:nicotinate phosphoribosyltransferase [Synechococcales bacterium]